MAGASTVFAKLYAVDLHIENVCGESGEVAILPVMIYFLTFGMAGIVLVVLGSLCLDGHTPNLEWCPARGGSIGIVVFGCMMVCVSGYGVNYARNR